MFANLTSSHFKKNIYNLKQNDVLNLSRVNLLRIYAICELEMWTARVKCGTYKLHGAVVDKEVLDLNTPVWSEFEVSVAL